MARLNEAPLPTESVDALKRRFVRQNRELAKNNSAQCLRIRALELEVSRLLAENLSFREEVLSLRAQQSDKRPQLDTTALVSVKDQLEAKLLEFGALVSELGNLPGPQSSNDATKNTDPSTWRPIIPVAALSGQAPRMSGIDEETRSPGGTLRANITSVPRLSDHSNASPDLGPPPVAHFECEDPIKFDPLPSDSTAPEQYPSDNDSIPDVLSVNLETRRRRKDGHSKLQIRRSSIFPTDPESEEQPQPVRLSAKKKLSVIDSENPNNVVVNDDFKFSRRSSIIPDFRNAESDNTTVENPLEDTEKPVLRPERKVLGNKNVNVSPRKQTTGGKDNLKNEDPPLKPSLKSTQRGRKSRTSSARSVSVAVPEAEAVVRTIEIAPPVEEPLETLQPKTPAPDLFSPTPSEPSAARDEGRDTPPPSGFKSMSSGPAALNGASRPSRRARASVNYAEPNLVSKMRRPTTDLGPAVDANGRRISSSLASADKKTMRTVTVKGDDAQSGGSEPTSPLGQKANREHVKSHQTTKSSSASGRTISALMSGSKSQGVNDEKAQEMGLYELKDSSPAEVAKGKGSRRHSSVAEASEHDLGLGEQVGLDLEVGLQEIEQPEKAPKHRAGRMERNSSRRRSMMV